MKVRHELDIHCRCPGDAGKDFYRLTLYVSRFLPCEEIVRAVADLAGSPAYQEVLTQRIANRLNARVKTVGAHRGGNTRTTVICDPEER